MLCTLLVHGLSASSNKGNFSIPFELINGLTIIEAEIDGVHGKYLLDTGSDGIIIDGETDSKNQNTIVSLGGESKSKTQELKLVRVGEFS